MDNGYSDNLTIDRIDNDGNYCPENCRWVDRITQANNTSSNRMITAWGETKTLAQWINDNRCKVSSGGLRRRLDKLQLDPETAISTKPYGIKNNED